MDIENLWQKFISDGRIETYLMYKNEQKLKEKTENDNKSVYNRRTDYKGTADR